VPGGLIANGKSPLVEVTSIEASAAGGKAATSKNSAERSVRRVARA
jgi:hypothetical protein